MGENCFDSDKLFIIINFLASEKGVPVDMFIEEVEKEIEAKKRDSSNIMELLMSLPSTEREKILNELRKPKQQVKKGEPMHTSPNKPSGRFQLKELEGWGTNELTNRKPYRIFIENRELSVKSWTDATVSFVKHLIVNGDLKKGNLPIYLSPRSEKSFINETGEQTANKDGVFKKVAEGFYVDIKYNGKYHILNMIRTLEKLCVTNKYLIEIEFR